MQAVEDNCLQINRKQQGGGKKAPQAKGQVLTQEVGIKYFWTHLDYKLENS